MKQLSAEAQALIAQTRHLDEPTLGDRVRLRERLDSSWAASSAAPHAGASLLQGKLLLSATTFVAMAGTGLWLATTNPAPPASLPTKTQLTAASPSATPTIPEPELEPDSADTSAREQAFARSSTSSLPQPSAKIARPSKPAPHASRLPQKRTTTPTPEAPPQRAPLPEPRSSELQPPTLAAQEAARPPRRHTEAPAAEAIGDEVMLLGAAQKELRAGQPTRALGYIQQHAFRFPNGALAQERAAVQTLALCALHRKTAARQVFEDLARRAPSAAVLPRIRRDCDF